MWLFVILKKSHGSCWLKSVAHLLLRYRVDRREAPDFHWYHHGLVMECGEHAPGPDSLLHPRLETPVAGGDDALHCSHCFLVVRGTLEAVHMLHSQYLCLCFKVSVCSGGCLSRPAGWWLTAEWRRPRSIWFSAPRWTEEATQANWTPRYNCTEPVTSVM